MIRMMLSLIALSILIGCSGSEKKTTAKNEKGPDSKQTKTEKKSKGKSTPNNKNQAKPEKSKQKSDAKKQTKQQSKPAPSLLTPLNDQQLSDGWIKLFDGQSLFGWKPAKQANWRVENGTIVVDEGEVGLLCTTTQYADYELSVEFNSAKGTNSGIFLHTPPVPTDPSADCYELNIADQDNPFPTGSLVRRKKISGPNDKTDWQKFDITVKGGKVIVKLDGKQILDFTDPRPLRRGFIGLQHNKGRVAFRNVLLRPLGSSSIFNGKDLKGWKEYPKMKSKFTVTKEGWMNVKDGKGQLETAKSYGDFVLQLQCITHADHLNSGIFFRCIPGDVMMGYESQIHNGFKDGNRAEPMDYGTGGIFRRTKARFVVADDQKWFHKTLIADGTHMAAWVNGIQVSDWTDERPLNDNPRRGSRVEPGTIQIQGHDPTTNISFRGLRIVELPQRRK